MREREVDAWAGKLHFGDHSTLLPGGERQTGSMHTRSRSNIQVHQQLTYATVDQLFRFHLQHASSGLHWFHWLFATLASKSVTKSLISKVNIYLHTHTHEPHTESGEKQWFCSACAKRKQITHTHSLAAGKWRLPVAFAVAKGAQLKNVYLRAALHLHI